MRWTKFKDNGRNSSTCTHMQTRCHTERRQAESDVMADALSTKVISISYPYSGPKPYGKDGTFMKHESYKKKRPHIEWFFSGVPRITRAVRPAARGPALAPTASVYLISGPCRGVSRVTVGVGASRVSPALYVSVSLATCGGLCRFGARAEAWAAGLPLGRKIYCARWVGSGRLGRCSECV